MSGRVVLLLLPIVCSVFGQTHEQRLQAWFEKSGSDDPNLRESASREGLDVLRPIVESNIQPLIGIFASALMDQSPYVRLQACRALSAAAVLRDGNATTLQELEPLIVTLTDDKHIEVKRAAVRTLALVAPSP